MPCTTLFRIRSRLSRVAHLAAALAFALALANPVLADCQGSDIFAELPEGQQREIRAASDAAPFARGLFFHARRGAAQVYLVGTYHLDDPRHSNLMDHLAPLLPEVGHVLVEAGPEEQTALVRQIGRDPGLIVDDNPQPLSSRLAPADWQLLRQALLARGVPPMMGARMRPWYLSMVLGIPPCAIEQMGAVPQGLDQRIITLAGELGLPVSALEPYDTLIRAFAGMTEAQQIDLLRQALFSEHLGEDMAVTLGESYFRGEPRLIWEFSRFLAMQLPGATPEQVEADMALMEAALITGRNRSWIPVIEAQAEQGPVLAAFGALHLSGEAGVLNLLAQRGWTVAPLTLP